MAVSYNRSNSFQKASVLSVSRRQPTERLQIGYLDNRSCQELSKCPSYIGDEGDELVGVHIIKSLVSKLRFAPFSTISFIVLLVLVVNTPFNKYSVILVPSYSLPGLGYRFKNSFFHRKPSSAAKVPLVFEPVHEISNNMVCATSKASDQPAQSDQSLC